MPRRDKLFVVGIGRSGTGAITRLMSEHRDVAIGLERYKVFLRDPGFELLPQHFERERFFDFTDGGTNISPLLDERWAEYYAPLEAKWDTARYVGDKMTALRFPRVWKHMPDSLFLCIIRDIREVAASWNVRAVDAKDVGWPEHQDAMAAVTAWNHSLERLERNKNNHRRLVGVVEHSRFFGDPEARTLRRILDWLDLPWTPEFAAAFSTSHEHYTGYVAKKRRTLPPEVEEFIERNADLERWRRIVDTYA